MTELSMVQAKRAWSSTEWFGAVLGFSAGLAVIMAMFVLLGMNFIVLSVMTLGLLPGIPLFLSVKAGLELARLSTSPPVSWKVTLLSGLILVPLAYYAPIEIHGWTLYPKAYAEAPIYPGARETSRWWYQDPFTLELGVVFQWSLEAPAHPPDVQQYLMETLTQQGWTYKPGPISYEFTKEQKYLKFSLHTEFVEIAPLLVGGNSISRTRGLVTGITMALELW